MLKRLPTDELHEYGFITEPVEAPSLFSSTPLTVYPDWVDRGDPVRFLPIEVLTSTPEDFSYKSCRAGRFVGVKDGELFVSMEDEEESYEDMCFAFDNTKQ